VLVKLAQLAADLPQVREVDLNPLLADEQGVIALDARVAIAPVAPVRPGPAGNSRFAIRPYPKEWERPVTLRDGTAVLIRPIRPEDEALYAPFFAEVTDQDLRLRFFAPIKEFSHTFVARLTQLDYARAMAFIAIDAASGAMLGVVRLHANANYDAAEYAVLVRSDCKGRGLGWLLMQTMIDYASAEGLQTVEGQVLQDNITMIAMCRELGFEITPDPQDPDLYVVKLNVPKRNVGG
jgi:acetyltransferase